MAARSSSADAALGRGGADTGVHGVARVPSQGPTAALRSIKRTVMQETVSKTVTERKESSKEVTDTRVSTEKRRDSHIETNTTEEVRTKRQEDTVESYDGVVPPAAATSEPTIVQHFVVPQAEGSASESRGSTVHTPEKKTKLPVAIRVKDDEQDAPEDTIAPSSEELSSSHKTSILRPTSQEDTEKRPSHKLGWQPQEGIALEKSSPVPLPVPKESKEDEEEEPAEPPPSRLNMRRKDSIAVAKVRLLRQQEHPSEEEEPDDEEINVTSPDKKHPLFMPATVITIISEQAEEDSEPPVVAFDAKPDLPSAIPAELHSAMADSKRDAHSSEVPVHDISAHLPTPMDEEGARKPTFK